MGANYANLLQLVHDVQTQWQTLKEELVSVVLDLNDRGLVEL